MMNNDFIINDRQKQTVEKYIQLLLKWNEKINLIGKSTINDIWNRHILDSAQLIKYLSFSEIQNSLCADFGTGAGLPGIILSILGVKNITLIEKSIQKCNFLKEAVKISNNHINIINDNIFNIKNKKFDIIFSRALANLNDLLTLVKPFCKTNTRCIFLKGQKWNDELKEAKKYHDFSFNVYDSDTSDEGKILILTNLLV